MSVSHIDIWVSEGVLGTPHYHFYTDPLGTEELTEQTFDQRNSYTFFRLYEAISRSFYISDTGYNLASTNTITITVVAWSRLSSDERTSTHNLAATGSGVAGTDGATRHRQPTELGR